MENNVFVSWCPGSIANPESNHKINTNMSEKRLKFRVGSTFMDDMAKSDFSDIPLVEVSK